MDEDSKLPFYAKASLFLIGLVAFTAILYIARSIIIPIVFSIIFAILLHPVVNFFVRFKVNRIVAIVFTLFLTSLTLFGFFALLFSQASQFSDTWPQLVDKFTETLNEAISGISGYFDINPLKIHSWITKTKDEFLNVSNEAIGQTLLSVGGVIMVLFLIPVYVFLMLYYHPIIIEFIHRLFRETHQTQVKEIVSQTKSVIHQYLVGLLIEAVIVAIMNISVLLILGVDYAVLLGIIGALLNVIPYIGGLVGVALPMMVALATKTSGWYPIYVMAGYYIIQLIDNNYIVPYIVASKVKINALFSIIVVFIGNALWGVPGMFLSIPLIAIVKLIFDHIDSLRPWGFLLGDTMPPLINVKPVIVKLKGKPI